MPLMIFIFFSLRSIQIYTSLSIQTKKPAPLIITRQLSQPPVIYRTFLFLENHVAVSRYILGVTGV